MAYTSLQVRSSHQNFIEDSYLLLDAIEALYSTPTSHIPVLALEIGTGSGIISAFVKGILKGNTFVLGIDIHLKAIEASHHCALLNRCQINLVNADALTCGFRQASLFDLIVCNPPYVPTTEEELLDAVGLEKSWAGGPTSGTNSMISYLLSQGVLESMLSPIGGTFLLLVESANRPMDLIARFLNCHSPEHWCIDVHFRAYL
ncbi:hypothetical protein DI09_3p160 [Mitosporidium daphniae]|uniref:Methyltransferase small domain-containing protein n=1 Tax=Mitosporidium daphniae TaxID=1485682 RepID=A0A098VR02_9MICR|nr:uncharacterized protein DI09_3p160 [Mitosporidium daphniae]KGG51254.1 hypothetical protein DI09_3p160 [Mitosporidium daphniae]|eukprot:XP_013237681.1 uncharacterized protein DI09_3p160 [Mitosporidium daphniae]